MIEVKRKQGESAESLVRRFSRRIQQSRVLLRAKDARFHRPTETKRKTKEKALRRMNIHEKKEYLKKIGQPDAIVKLKK